MIDTNAGVFQLSIETSGNIKGQHIDFEDVKLEVYRIRE